METDKSDRERETKESLTSSAKRDTGSRSHSVLSFLAGPGFNIGNRTILSLSVSAVRGANRNRRRTLWSGLPHSVREPPIPVLPNCENPSFKECFSCHRDFDLSRHGDHLEGIRNHHLETSQSQN
jgi:hypothetical protein